MSKEVTMRDIAKELNISAVSVSKAITGKDGVSDSIREKIVKKAEEMGYIYTCPERYKDKQYNFDVVVSQRYISDNAFYSKLFQSLTVEFGKRHHSCMLEIVSEKDEDDGVLPGNVAAKRVDGVIVLGPVSEPFKQKILIIDIPCIFVDNYAQEDNMDCVMSDNVYGSYMLTNYLVEMGHKEIAFVGSKKATNSIMDRYLGYLKCLLQNGLTASDKYVLDDRDSKGNLTEIELPPSLPDAFVCNCDETAYRLVEQLKSKNVRVPEDVSVVGFDDYIFATLSTPQLTTYKVDMEEMSKNAAELMIMKMDRPGKSTGRHVISGQIIIRDSVKDLR